MELVDANICKISVSSVLDRNAKEYGKKYLLDGREDTCWNSDQVRLKLCFFNPNFGQKSKFWSKIQILVKNPNFGQKSKFWSKIQILVKNPNFGQKS